MPDLAEPVVCRFDEFLLDRQARTLTRLQPDGEQTSVEIGSRAFQILGLLVDRSGEIVSQRELMDAVWPNVAVEPNNLTVQLSALRRVLDADRKQGSCIRNIPGRGYRFMPTVTETSRPLRDVPAALPADDHQDIEHAAGSSNPPVAARRGQLAWIGAMCLVFVAVLASAVWYSNRTPSSPAERQRLSLVVLPFGNLGGDGLTDDTVDAITDDLTNDLSRLPDSLVIARSSASTYKGKMIDVRRVGEELGVRYAVEGSVRKVEGALRVNAQLVSTENGAHLWAERFEVSRDGIGYGVDDIVRQIAFVLNARIVDSEAARSLRERPSNADVADILLRARSIYNRPPTPQQQNELVALYERALELDPNSAAALAGLANALLEGFSNVEDPTAPDRERRATELLTRAELLRPNDLMVMWTRVYLLGWHDRCPEVIVAAQRAVEVHPTLTGPRQWRGICLMRMGRPAEAIPELQQAIRINPRNPSIGIRYFFLGFALLFSERYDEAIIWLQRSLVANPNERAWRRSTTFAAIAAAQALAGQVEQARSNAAEASRIWPVITVRSYFPFNLSNPSAAPQVSRLHDGLRLAGIRDHADEDVDSNLVSDNALHTDYETPTPTTVPGAQIIRTPELAKLVELRKPLVLDTFDLGRSIPGAIALWGAGIGGDTSDRFQDRLARKMQQLTAGDRAVPIVAMGLNSERYQGRNLALRLVALGYTQVYWYRGGREAWQVAGLPDAALTTQDW
jgi:TolB-like protein/DNA-binding winged helix-turn-helix (wHTH) protein